jgi:hypothetical protein
MGYWWSDPDREKPKYLQINLLYYYCVHHKSNMDYPGIEP